MSKSTIRVGTTEGRFCMIMPTLMRQFKEMYNDYDIRGIIGNAEQLREMLEKGELDIAFSGMPFCRSLPNLHCMQILDHLFEREEVALDCVHTSGHFDLHQKMAQENLAACFSLSMYLPHLHELNLYNDNKRLVFPIKDLTETNPVYILINKDKAYVEGIDEFKNLLKNAVKELEVSDM
jgi:hypothetical protein